MTGAFAKSTRSGECALAQCKTVIQLGELVYLWHKLERQAVCLPCAKARWGYEPSQEDRTPAPKITRDVLGFDSTKTILKRLQAANANDPKTRAAGGDR